MSYLLPLATISSWLVDIDKPSPQVTHYTRVFAATIRRCIQVLSATPEFSRSRSNTPADFVVFELPADLATDVTQAFFVTFFLLQLIAQLSKPTSAGFVKRVDQDPKLGLTTAPLVFMVHGIGKSRSRGQKPA